MIYRQLILEMLENATEQQLKYIYIFLLEFLA